MLISSLCRTMLLCLFFLIMTGENISAVTHIDTLTSRISLAGEWRIKRDDNLIYSSIDYDDSGWSKVKMPGSIVKYLFSGEIEDFSIDDFYDLGGVFWLRKTVFISSELKGERLGLILGTIGNADETFFNGYKIGGMGEFPPDEFSMWNIPRHYIVPENVIMYGQKNIISIRLYYYIYCEMLGTLAVTNENDWSFDKSLKDFINITLNYVIIFMGIPLFLMFAIFYIRRRDQEYLYYCLQLLCGLFIVLDACDFFFWKYLGNTLLRFKVLGLSWVALNVVHPIFLHRIYNLKRKKTETVLWIYLAVIVLMLGIISGNITEIWHVIVLIIITTGIGVYNLSCHITAFLKKRAYSKLFSLFGCIVILGAMHDGFVYLPKFGGYQLNILGYNFEIMMFPYSAAALYIGTALVFIYRFIDSMNEVDELNRNLEKKVLERTEELQSAMQELEDANKKLIQVNTELEESETIHNMDMAMAVNVQSAFLPVKKPASKTLDITVYYRPMSGVSGDFYDFFHSNGDISGIGLFDVSGHGISSGLLTLLAKSIISKNFSVEHDDRLNRIIELVNNELIKEFGGVNYFLTGILLRFLDDAVEYVNCAHPDLLLKKGLNGNISRIPGDGGERSSGLSLGIEQEDIYFSTIEFSFNSGDTILIYTDALKDTLNNNREHFGEERILDSLSRASGASSENILDSILKDFNDFIENNENVKDDLTVIVIKKK